jgi:enamine deaminase RidA (YjgF/YER057c/UK114 family)
VDEAAGYQAARLTALNMLATLKAELGELSKVRRILKLRGMVNCTEDFTRVPDVINGASDLLIEDFGDVGRHARSAVGMQQLHYAWPWRSRPSSRSTTDGTRIFGER